MKFSNLLFCILLFLNIIEISIAKPIGGTFSIFKPSTFQKPITPSSRIHFPKVSMQQFKQGFNKASNTLVMKPIKKFKNHIENVNADLKIDARRWTPHENYEHIW